MLQPFLQLTLLGSILSSQLVPGRCLYDRHSSVPSFSLLLLSLTSTLLIKRKIGTKSKLIVKMAKSKKNYGSEVGEKQHKTWGGGSNGKIGIKLNNVLGVEGEPSSTKFQNFLGRGQWENFSCICLQSSSTDYYDYFLTVALLFRELFLLFCFSFLSSSLCCLTMSVRLAMYSSVWERRYAKRLSFSWSIILRYPSSSSAWGGGDVIFILCMYYDIIFHDNMSHKNFFNF